MGRGQAPTQARRAVASYVPSVAAQTLAVEPPRPVNRLWLPKVRTYGPARSVSFHSLSSDPYLGSYADDAEVLSGLIIRPRAMSRGDYLMLASIRFTARNSLDLAPCFRLLRLERAFPSFVFGPVDRSHGRQRCIAKACRLRLSMLQPFMPWLQYFV